MNMFIYEYMDITKQKQTHRHREQTSGYEWGEVWGEGQDRVGH